MNIKVESIKIVMGKKEIELSVADAESLYTELGKLFKKDLVYMPTIIERDKYWPWTTTSGSSSTSISLTGYTQGDEVGVNTKL